MLENLYYSILLRIEKFLSGPNWLWKLTFSVVGLGLFLSFPPYNLFFHHVNGTGHLDAWEFIENQSHSLFHPKDIGYDVRRENMVFRWTLPLLSFLTDHNLPVILILQAILGVTFIFWIARYLFELTGNKVTTALFVLSISQIFVGVWHFAEVHGYGDGIAYFCILAAMLHPNRLVIFLMLMTGFFTDERAVMAGGFVILWYVVRNAYETQRFDLKSLATEVFINKSMVVWIAWITYFSIRFFVQARYFADHSYSTMGTPVLFAKAHRNGLGSSFWGTFEGTWLLILAASAVIIMSKRYLLGLMLAAGFLVLTVSGIYVHDIDRSLSYGFPFLIISFFILYHNSDRKALQLLLFFCALICILHPQIFYMGYNQILWLEPLPLKAFHLLSHLLGWPTFD